MIFIFTLYCYYYIINFNALLTEYALTAAHEVSATREPISIARKRRYRIFRYIINAFFRIIYIHIKCVCVCVHI